MADETLEGVTITDGGVAETYTADTSEETQEVELLAGKFKSQEDLIKAYSELEKKLGGAKPEAEEATEEETTEAKEAEEATKDEDKETEEESPYGPVVTQALKDADLSVEDIRKQYTDNDGQLDDDTYAAFEKAGFPRPMVESYLRGISQANENVTDEVKAQVSEIMESVGGEAEFAKVRSYVDNSFTGEERKAYNDAINSGDPAQAANAVRVAHAEYLKDIGTETPLNGGGKTTTGAAGYPSEDAWLDAMADPKYKTSQAYRDEVAAKVQKSAFFVAR